MTTPAAMTAAAFTVTAVVFGLLLIGAATAVGSFSREAMRPVRMVGPVVKRWSGYVLVSVGLWFLVLAAAPNVLLGLG